jgi:DNA-binding transcriptional LysR family regulator
MTNEQIKAFLAVVEQGSFRKAAQKIFKTQAAVSSSVKALEDEFDVKLFSREQYRPQLTEAGEAFFHNAKLTMNQFERLDKVGQQLAQGIESRFNIVISIAFPLPPLLKKIRTICDQFPNTQFKIFPEALNGVVERIDDDADLGFGPGINLNASHEKIPVAEVTFINVAAPDYFKKDASGLQGDSISLEEIEDYSQIVTRDSAKEVDKASFHTAPNRKSWSVNDFHTKKELILAGLGWGGLPQHLIQAELDNKSLIAINVEGIPQTSSGTLYMFRLRNQKHGPVASKFWQTLKQAYEEE